MNANWGYDRGSHRESHEAVVSEPDQLEKLLREVHERGEPTVVTIYGEALSDDDLPAGMQVGLGHAEHAFAVQISEGGGYLTIPETSPPQKPISFDVAGVPTGYPPEYLTIRPDTAIRAARTFLHTNGQTMRTDHIP